MRSKTRSGGFRKSRSTRMRLPLARHPASVRQRRVRAGRGASRRRSALRTDCPAVLGLVAPPHNSLRSLRSLRSNRRGESELMARCARGPRALRSSAPPRRAATCPHAPLLKSAVVLQNTTSRVPPSRQAVPGGGDFWGEEQRRAGLGARSALHQLTRRICLNAASEARVVSYATRARTEQRTAVGAQRRPPQHEPPPGTACRDALPLRELRHLTHD
jgi:hypothetical protein